ncbi:MAG: hypothetical protein MI799_01060 [Desulfobacterales bacterium]|nr:hypothetical protein [Desulfobacterales bacterium]
MKINAFSVDFSSSRTFSQTQTVEFSESYTFNNVLDGLPEQNQTDLNVWDPSASKAQWFNPWLTPVTGGRLDALSPTRRFMTQLNNLRSIAVEMLNQLNSRVSVPGQLRMTGLDQVYTGAVPENDFSVFSQWEHTTTTTFTYEEQEKVNVSANGTVRTADDQEFDFSMDLFLERQFFNESQVQVTQTGYALMDPLVIQTGAQGPMLQGGQFSFDLDMDGDQEELAGLSSGYAFLALDLNRDGTINDGSELFGPSTGDGLGELADYDQDGNMWIDENDEMFDQFVLWNPENDAGTTLTRLKDAGVGAIYLGGVSSQFNLTTADNELLGQITDTSLALGEDGSVMPVYEMAYKV